MSIDTTSIGTSGAATRWLARVRRDLAALPYAPDEEEIAALRRALASRARERDAPRVRELAAPPHPAYRRELVASADDRYSALLITWPPGHRTPLHDHAGLWGIELVLDGALAVDEFALDGDRGNPRLVHARSLVLGIGDAATFGGEDYAHRCRNLSITRSALSLHVYGGSLEGYHAYHHDAGGRYRARPLHAQIDAALI